MSTPNMEETMLPDEAARFLGISTQKLSRLRRQGKLNGTRVGKTNLFIYTPGELRKADLTKQKRGPKPKK